MDYIKQFPIWPFTIIAALIGVLGVLIAQRISRRHVAVNIFRNIIHTELKGIYPSIELHMPANEINSRILQSIPNIQLAVSNFMGFVPFYRKRGFNIAAQKYYETARNTEWESQIAHQMFPSIQTPGCLSPKDKFNHAVENLLKYAKEK